MSRFVVALSVGLVGVAAVGFAQPVSPSSADSGRRFIDLTVGMGIDIHSAVPLFNYINFMSQPGVDEKLHDYASAIEFYAVPEIQVAQEWSVGIEYAMLIKSYSIQARNGFSRSEFSYQVHMPTLLVHHLLFGSGYRVKLGGGLGYHVAEFTQGFPTIGAEETVSARGLALKLDAAGNTRFDDTMYGSIGVDIRWDPIGALARTPGLVPATSASTPLPKMNFFSAGLKLGVTFQLN